MRILAADGKCLRILLYLLFSFFRFAGIFEILYIPVYKYFKNSYDLVILENIQQIAYMVILITVLLFKNVRDHGHLPL